ncbi:MAG: 50S ribosomal protein L16 [archaeon]|nr:50S ribosomal protein L16 [archaeon]
MGLRPARIYKDFKRPYTRRAVKVHRKSYIKGVPGRKLNNFDMGNTKGEFGHTVYLVLDKDAQLRHNALEACRVAANAYIKKKVEDKSYCMKVRVFPHNVLREHAQAAIAQADRFYQGMSHPFGKPSSTAARVKKGQPVLSVGVNAEDIDAAKEAFRRAGDKLGTRNRVVIE